MSLLVLDPKELYSVLQHTDNMTDVLSVILSCKTMFSRLAYCLPTTIDSNIPEPQRSRLCVERILAVIVGCNYLQKLDETRQPGIPDEFFSVLYCNLMDETRLVHLKRNYYHFVSPGVGLRPEAVVAQLVAAQPQVLDQLLNLPTPVISSLLQNWSDDELDLRLALARRISLLIDYINTKTPIQLLMVQRRRAAQRKIAERCELLRMEEKADLMNICFTTEDRPNERVSVEPLGNFDIISNRLLRMNLSPPGQNHTEAKSVMFAFDPKHNRWKSVHVMNRKLKSFLPDVRLTASFLSVSS